MSDRLTSKAEMEITSRNIIYRHYNKQCSDNTDQIKVFQQDDITDTSCEAHSAHLCDNTNDECDDQ